MAAETLSLTFRSVDERTPGPKWRALFDEFLEAYEAWFLKEGDAARPRYAACRRALREHLPELVPLYENLVDLAGGGDRAARLLSLYRPTPYLAGCSQAAWTRGGEAVLVRNYDYSPDLTDGVVLRSRWTGVDVVAMTDCLWGALDGINEHGLAVALSFGGRTIVGDGFGVPLILRYVLEIARDTAGAVEVLRRVPSHMAYNVSVCDAGGRAATVYLAPDRPAEVSAVALATNHQQQIDWPEHAAFTETLERHAFLQRRLAAPAETLATFADRFLAPPIHRTSYEKAWGTVYTAAYDCARRAVEFRWPGETWPLSLASFGESRREIRFT